MVNNKQFTCPIKSCEVTFKTHNQRHGHIIKVHTMAVPCPQKECGSMIKPSSMMQHMKNVHHKIKETCEICGSEYLASRMWIHKKVCLNGGKKEFHCTVEGCDKSFRTSYDRTAHIKNVHLLAPLPCPYCHKSCKPESLLQHIKKIHEGKTLEYCPQCQKKLTESLRKHLKSCKGYVKKHDNLVNFITYSQNIKY